MTLDTTTEYLKLDSTRVSFAEYWRWKPGVPFLFLAGRKLLRWPLPLTVAVPAVAVIERVDPLGQPAELVAALQEPIAACEATGRTIRFWYTVPTIGLYAGLAAALVGADGRSVAMAAVAATRGGASLDLVLGLASRLRGGRFLTTGPGKSLFDPPPEVEAVRLPGRSYADLVAAHDQATSRRTGELLPCGDPREVILELQSLQLRANLARGVYVPASPLEVARLTT